MIGGCRPSALALAFADTTRELPVRGTGRRNTAVVLAGGVGTRVGRELPKQLLEIAGRTILEHTVAAFQSHPQIDEIVVMMAAGHVATAEAVVRGHDKVVAVHEGSDTRSGTTVRALEVLETLEPPAAEAGDRLPGDAGAGDRKVLLHDAARPLVTARIISDCLAALDHYDAVEAAIPTADTIVAVAEDGTLIDVPRRATLRRVQTPQGFRLSVIRRAYARASHDAAFEATDDASVVHRYLPEVPILVVAGDERNLKVTDPVDLRLAEELLRGSPDEPG
jgi:2-C-methyl-D-erythritol 4-phosphate cytidylyltransferase